MVSFGPFGQSPTGLFLLARRPLLASMPQPCFVLFGPGLYDDEAFLLVADEPWTPEAVRDTLWRIYSPADIAADGAQAGARHAAWLDTWAGLVLESSGRCQ